MLLTEAFAVTNILDLTPDTQCLKPWLTIRLCVDVRSEECPKHGQGPRYIDFSHLTRQCIDLANNLSRRGCDQWILIPVIPQSVTNSPVSDGRPNVNFRRDGCKIHTLLRRRTNGCSDVRWNKMRTNHRTNQLRLH